MGLFHLADHLIPLLITLGIIVAVIAFWIGKPYLRYIDLVSKADNQEDLNELAKDLAEKAGGKRVDTSSTWESFLPAALVLRLTHMDRVEDLTKTK